MARLKQDLLGRQVLAYGKNDIDSPISGQLAMQALMPSIVRRLIVEGWPKTAIAWESRPFIL
jgi:hypothetical protein